MASTSKMISNYGLKGIKNNLQKKEQVPFLHEIDDTLIKKHLHAENKRARIYTPELTLQGFLSQAISDDSSCQNAVSKIIAATLSDKSADKLPSANTAAYSKARMRLCEQGVAELSKDVANKVCAETTTPFLWRNRHVKLIDGTTVSAIDTKENQQEYPQPSTQKKG